MSHIGHHANGHFSCSSPCYFLLSQQLHGSCCLSPDTSEHQTEKHLLRHGVEVLWISQTGSHLEVCDTDPVFAFMEFKRPSRLRSREPAPLPLGKSPPVTNVWVSLLPLCPTGHGPKRENSAFSTVAPFSTSLQRQCPVESFT